MEVTTARRRMGKLLLLCVVLTVISPPIGLESFSRVFYVFIDGNFFPSSACENGIFLRNNRETFCFQKYVSLWTGAR